jgi:enoyl-CoA hydratase
MEKTCRQIGDSVLLNICGPYLHIELNSPATLNSLTPIFLEWLHQALDIVEQHEEVRLLLLSGRGEKGFCAGGNVKLLARAVQNQRSREAMEFFEKEYELDLRLHELKTPLVVLADGICMGGGLGLAAGADLVIASQATRMAMPETLIGFFPDVGASRWLFNKTPPGYPEYLGLLGPELVGAACLRTGLATHLVDRERLPGLLERLEDESGGLPREREAALDWIQDLAGSYSSCAPEANPQKDEWVRSTFEGLDSVPELRERLMEQDSPWSAGALQALEARSPTAPDPHLATAQAESKGQPGRGLWP